MDVVEKLPLKKNDIQGLFDLGLVYEKDNYLLWNEDKKDWDSRYNDIRDMALNRNLLKYKDTILIWTFPADVFHSFKDVYILTYLFEAQIQKYYYDLHNIKYEKYIAVNDQEIGYTFIKKPKEYSDKEIKASLINKINILEHEKLNKIGDDPFTLSKSWYIKATDSILHQLKKHTENYFKNIIKSKASDNLWTTYKDYQHKLRGQRYTKSFVSCNTRATNEYRKRKNLAYLINRYPNTIIDNFLKTKGIEIDKDKYALSEMIQWIWRSSIRDNKEINIYIPSKRMRVLLYKWLNDEEIKFSSQKN